MIEFVFLDLDDTLFDFKLAERIAIGRTLEELGVAPEEKILKRYSEINKSCWEKLERGEYTREEVLVNRFALLFSEIGSDVEPLTARRLYEKKLGIGHYFIDGATELLDTLYGKYKLYITSNGTKPVQDPRIASSGIARYFDKIFISEVVGANKPSPEFFKRVFGEIEGFDKERAIIVGDSLTSDILGGKNAGIKTCLFNPKKKANTTGIIPDYEISSLYELDGLLKTL